MNVLFLTFLSPDKHVWGYPFGPGYLSAVLEQHNHNTLQLLESRFNLDGVSKTIHRHKTDLICVSSTSDNINHVNEIVPKLSENFDIPIIIGGNHATVCPEESINIPSILGVCRGEGELALLEFVESLERGKDVLGIKNFWFKHDSKIIQNPVRPLINNLDSLPFPDRENFNYNEFLKNSSFGLEFSSSRGCVFNCTYCINSTLKSLYKNPKIFFRRRSVDNLLQEVREVTRRYSHIENIYFHDDVFTIDKNWLREFSIKYSNQIGLPFRINACALHFDREVAILLKNANCAEVAIGVETGDENLRMNILNKRISNDQLIKAFRVAREVGLRTRAYNMIGIPGETEESLKKTVEFNRLLGATYVNAPFFRPYPGTPIYTLCIREGLFRSEVISDYLNETMLKLPTISDKRLYFYKRSFNFLHKYPWAEGFLNFLDSLQLTKNKTAFDLLYSVSRRFKMFLESNLSSQINCIS